MSEPAERGDRPEYTVYRARRPRPWRAAEAGGPFGLPEEKGPRGGGLRDRVTAGRVVRWVALALAAWLALSLVVFLISAQLQEGEVSEAAENALDSSGYVLTSASNVLVLGSDLRTKEPAEPGSSTKGPSRADSIMLLRVGGGKSARLSIPRDTVVDIPGHGPDKINAAYAIGGPALAINTVKDFLGIDVHHVIEVSFENFPKLIDSMGGIDVRTGCVVSKINGGFRNGGYTLRLRRGENHLNGRQALALARTRKNECRPNENDITRVRRQQQILSAVRSRLLSPATFVRLPWVSWRAPQTVRSDMAGPSLLGMFASMAVTGSGQTRVLRPTGATTTRGGGSGLVVSEEERRREVRRFLRG